MRKRRYKKFKRYSFKLKPKFTKAAAVVFFCAALFFCLGYFVYTSEAFKLKEGDVKANVELSRSLMQRIKGKSLFSLEIKSIASYLLKEHPEYKTAGITKMFPSGLDIDVEKRLFFAQIKDKKFYPIDRDYVILTDGNMEPYDGLIPIEISGNSRYFEKGYILKDEGLEQAFALVDVLKKENFFDKFKVTLINPESLPALYMLIEFSDEFLDADSGIVEIKVIVGYGDFQNKISFLKTLVNEEIKDKISLVKYIDLRYKKAYIGFKR